MTTSNRILDEFARLMTDAAGMAQGVRREAETMARSQLERLMQDMDFVSREEFDAVRAMAIAAREENEALTARVAALEAALATAPQEAAAKPRSPRATPPKSA